MGWLRNLRKHTADLNPEPTSLSGAGSSGDPSGTSGVAGGSYGVVPAGGGARTGGVIVAQPVDAGIIIDGIHIGCNYKGEAYNSCSHGREDGTLDIIIIAGCIKDDIMEWLSCGQCHMNALHDMRSVDKTFLSCMHECADLIYTYLPNHPNYPSLGGRSFDYKGGIVK